MIDPWPGIVAREAVLALLNARQRDATICPSEVARQLVQAGFDQAPDRWRDAMPLVHEAVDQLVDAGSIRLSWKCEALRKRDGAYRIGRGVFASSWVGDAAATAIGENLAAVPVL